VTSRKGGGKVNAEREKSHSHESAGALKSGRSSGPKDLGRKRKVSGGICKMLRGGAGECLKKKQGRGKMRKGGG